MEHVYLKIIIDCILECVQEPPEPLKDGSTVEIHDFFEINRIAERLMECYDVEYPDWEWIDYSICTENENTLRLNIYQNWTD